MAKNAAWIGLAALIAFLVVAFVMFGPGDVPGDAGAEIPIQDPALVAGGEVVYEASCAACHGSDLRGTDQGPSLLSTVYAPNRHADFAFVLAAQQGVRRHHWDVGDMPAVVGLADESLEAVVAYVRENQRLSGFEVYPP